ncbi:MAG: pentapeptide repeat-containing protein [Rhodospirillales bacterium]|nr:pentapeptide repeat-containing protein [Rhodospirillales bacterium]
MRPIPFRGFLVATTLALATAAGGNAWAWSDTIQKDGKDVNTLCKYEPESQCSWAVRIGANIPGVDMNHASMASMRLDGANMEGANLEGAILQLSNLKGVNLKNGNLERAHLHGVNFQGADLSSANLKHTNLLDADLRGANLKGASLDGAILIKANLSSAIWTDGRICAEESIGECR